MFVITVAGVAVRTVVLFRAMQSSFAKNSGPFSRLVYIGPRELGNSKIVTSFRMDDRFVANANDNPLPPIFIGSATHSLGRC